MLYEIRSTQNTSKSLLYIFYQHLLDIFSQRRDLGDHFKVVGLKNLANTKVSVFGAIYLTFGRHIIYNLNKYNINVPTCYTNVYPASDNDLSIYRLGYPVKTAQTGNAENSAKCARFMRT